MFAMKIPFRFIATLKGSLNNFLSHERNSFEIWICVSMRIEWNIYFLFSAFIKEEILKISDFKMNQFCRELRFFIMGEVGWLIEGKLFKSWKGTSWGPDSEELSLSVSK